MFMRILRWGYIPMSAFFIALGVSSDVREATTLGVASWLWYLIGYVLLLAITIFIIFSLSRENKQLRKPLEEQVSYQLREKRIAQRQIYADRKQPILDALMDMDNYVAKIVDQQTITAKQFMGALNKVFSKKSFLSLFVGAFTISSKGRRQKYVDYNMKLTINTLAKINTSLKTYKLGTLVAQKKETYKELDQKLRELGSVFSLDVINDISQVILYINIVNCLRLIDLDRPFWKNVSLKHINEKSVLAFQTMLANSQWQISNIMRNAIGKVSEDIDKYLEGE